MKSGNFEKILIAFILAGIIIRFFAFFFYQPEHGAVLQAAMAKGLIQKGEFVMEFGSIFNEDSTEPEISRHFPPLYPLVIALSAGQPYFPLNLLQDFSLKLMLLTGLMLFVLTGILFGRTAALFVTASYLLHAAFMDNTAKCLGENLQILLLSAFLFFVISAERKHFFYIPAGLFLGLAYLSKSTLPFWITLAIVILYAIYIVLKKQESGIYVCIGLFLFIVPVSTWGFRNFHNFGTFETSPYISSMLNLQANSLNEILHAVALNLPVMLLILLIPLLLFHHALRFIKLSDFTDSILLIFSFGTFLAAVCYASLFMVTEDRFLPYNSIRYALLSYVPLMWLIVRHLDFRNSSVIRQSLIMLVIFILGSSSWLGWALFTDDKPLINEADPAAAEYIASSDVIRETDSITIGFSDRINKNDLYYYLFALESAFGNQKNINLKFVEFSVENRQLVNRFDFLVMTEDLQVMPGNFELVQAFGTNGRTVKNLNNANRLVLRAIEE